MPTPFIIFLVLAVIAITVAAKLIHHRNRDQRDADEISPAGCWPGGSVITGVK